MVLRCQAIGSLVWGSSGRDPDHLVGFGAFGTVTMMQLPVPTLFLNFDSTLWRISAGPQLGDASQVFTHADSILSPPCRRTENPRSATPPTMEANAVVVPVTLPPANFPRDGHNAQALGRGLNALVKQVCALHRPRVFPLSLQIVRSPALRRLVPTSSSPIHLVPKPLSTRPLFPPHLAQVAAHQPRTWNPVPLLC